MRTGVVSPEQETDLNSLIYKHPHGPRAQQHTRSRHARRRPAAGIRRRGRSPRPVGTSLAGGRSDAAALDASILASLAADNVPRSPDDVGASRNASSSPAVAARDGIAPLRARTASTARGGRVRLEVASATSSRVNCFWRLARLPFAHSTGSRAARRRRRRLRSTISQGFATASRRRATGPISLLLHRRAPDAIDQSTSQSRKRPHGAVVARRAALLGVPTAKSGATPTPSTSAPVSVNRLPRSSGGPRSSERPAAALSSERFFSQRSSGQRRCRPAHAGSGEARRPSACLRRREPREPRGAGTASSVGGADVTYFAATAPFGPAAVANGVAAREVAKRWRRPRRRMPVIARR